MLSRQKREKNRLRRRIAHLEKELDMERKRAHSLEMDVGRLSAQLNGMISEKIKREKDEQEK